MPLILAVAGYGDDFYKSIFISDGDLGCRMEKE